MGMLVHRHRIKNVTTVSDVTPKTEVKVEDTPKKAPSKSVKKKSK